MALQETLDYGDPAPNTVMRAYSRFYTGTTGQLLAKANPQTRLLAHYLF